MSQNPEMRQHITDRILEHLRHSLGKANKTVEQFAEQYYRNVPVADLLTMDAHDLAGAVLSQWNYLRTQKGDALRCYNPHPERDGWQCGHTVVELAVKDRPFLVASLALTLEQLGLKTHFSVHPVLNITRGKNPKLDSSAESLMLMQLYIDRINEPAKLSAVAATLEQSIDRVAAATNDWATMRSQLQGTVNHLDDEGSSFVNWLGANHFTLLGSINIAVSRGKAKPTVDSALGVVRLLDDEALQRAFPLNQAEFFQSTASVQVARSQYRAHVHRPGNMTLIAIAQRDKRGSIKSWHCVLGFFAAIVQQHSARSLPLLDNKFEEVMSRSGFSANSHNARALAHTLEELPRHVLYESSAASLSDLATRIMGLQERQHVRLFGLLDAHRSFCDCLVYVPRDRYSRELRGKIQRHLESALRSRNTDFDALFSSTSRLARIHYTFELEDGTSQVDWRQLEQEISDLTRSWTSQLHGALIDHYGEDQGTQLSKRYGEAFSDGYREDFLPRAALVDVAYLRDVEAHGNLVMSLSRAPLASDDSLRLKLFNRGDFIALSTVLPMLENMGLSVEGERPYTVETSEHTLWIHEFSMRRQDGGHIELDTINEDFKALLGRAWNQQVENDGFNALVLMASLQWRDTVILRTYAKYLQQIRAPFALDYIVDCLRRNTGITGHLVELFHARFDPTKKKGRQARCEKIIARLDTELEQVISLDDDRILRSYCNLITATLRTNYYQNADNGDVKEYLAIKLDPALVEGMPLPRPKYEIFVCAPRFEATHLRGGPVARGGLRWSDRLADFRTEVLGLVKAQMVKNSVIVPVGSKGGFVLKRPPQKGGREALINEGIACYKNFLRGLLDLTDNLVGSSVKAPNNVVRYDGDDPYLVVAADKGTATFSDFANAVSGEYGFWLGDAFASGGSNGYDHKGMGITAKGAWESVKRHFRELGHNTQTEDFTVIGIGDMGGDVFGNGMLLSEHIRLIGAFNHLHIFIDPEPNAAQSYEERTRLFALPGSSWEDYNTALISQGGGIFSRSAKSIPLSPQMQAMLDVKDKQMPPNQLINAMLKARVDLLWNGGIGTYIKASTETHADAADRGNDVLRVDANTVRARVVGEGGNLGITQKARIELAQCEVLLYTDAVDNSAGVDCSDHEVNIKILLDQVVSNGDMTDKQRNILLEEMTYEVSELVLVDNYQQTQCISRANALASHQIEEHSRFMVRLEEQGLLDRDIEFLPNRDDITDRINSHQGLTRPELSVLVSYAKMTLFDQIAASDLPDDPRLVDTLLNYFPTPLRERYSTQIQHHRLRREIIATVITNEFVNRMGPSFAYRMEHELNASGAEVVKAYLMARDIFNMNATWHHIESLDNFVDATLQLQLHTLVNGLVERAAQWLLRHGAVQQPLDQGVMRFQADVAKMSSKLDLTRSATMRVDHEKRVEYFCDLGVPKDLAERTTAVIALSSALDIVSVALQLKVDVNLAAKTHFLLGEYLPIQWMRDEISALKSSNPWHALAHNRLRGELHERQRELCAELLSKPQKSASTTLEHWAHERSERLEQLNKTVADMRSVGVMDFATLSLAVHELRGLSDAH